MALETGERLGPYEIVAPIGAGGMGEVYRARDTRLGRDVAIKVSSEHFSERMEREARTIASLNHPHIATLHDVGEHAGSLYLAMEYVKGAPLKGPYPLKDAIGYAIQIAEGLAAAHDAGIVHRDLKPANVLVTEKGSIKILDFGLAKLTERSRPGATTETQSMSISGTPGYLAPEQLEGKPADSRSDIFAFGCILYELVGGRRAFPGDTLAASLAATAMMEPKALEGIPDELDRLIRLCLRKDPERRLQNIGDARIALEDLRDEPRTTVAGAQAVRPSERARLSVAWAVAAAACLVAGALAAIHFREKPPVAPEAMRFQIRLPDKVVFNTGAFTVSPDGRHIAFSATGPSMHAAVWVQDFDGNEARELPDTSTGNTAPPFFWSPDSRYIVFSATKLRKADIQGGGSQDICDKPGPPVGGSWNRDGVIIFGSTAAGLWRVPAAGGTPVPLTVLNGSRQEHEHELPEFLPDGKHFLYLNLSADAGQSGIYAGSLDDPPERQGGKRVLATGFNAQFVPSGGGDGSLLFLRDGSLMAQPFDAAKLALKGSPSVVAERVGTVYQTGFFSATRDVLVYRTAATAPGYQFTWVDEQRKPRGTVGEAGLIGNPRISPDGKRAVYRKFAPNLTDSDLWLLDLTRGVSTRFTFGPRSVDVAEAWSPDSSEIVFCSNRNGAYDLYRKPANSAKDEELLLRSDRNKYPWSWSRDGRFLLYTEAKAGNDGNEDIWVLPMQGGGKPYPFAATRFMETEPAFSPDGKWVAYQTNETGRTEIYVRAFSDSPGGADAGGKWMVSNASGHSPKWRDDGKALFYVVAGVGLMTVPVDTSRGFQAGTPKLMFPSAPGVPSGDVTGDFKRVLLTTPVEQKVSQTFTVVANWRAGLQR
jgi:Tol biopolymer transport system component